MVPVRVILIFVEQVVLKFGIAHIHRHLAANTMKSNSQCCCLQPQRRYAVLLTGLRRNSHRTFCSCQTCRFQDSSPCYLISWFKLLICTDTMGKNNQRQKMLQSRMILVLRWVQSKYRWKLKRAAVFKLSASAICHIPIFERKRCLYKPPIREWNFMFNPLRNECITAGTITANNRRPFIGSLIRSSFTVIFPPTASAPIIFL
jgi:hypothetical protein